MQAEQTNGVKYIFRIQTEEDLLTAYNDIERSYSPLFKALVRRILAQELAQRGFQPVQENGHYVLVPLVH